MEQLVSEQAARIERGELGIDEDVALHREIAQASGNDVLASLVSVLRQSHRYHLIVTSARSIMGSGLVVDHREIVTAIRLRNPDDARNMMDHHLRGLTQDFNRYVSR